MLWSRGDSCLSQGEPGGPIEALRAQPGVDLRLSELRVGGVPVSPHRNLDQVIAEVRSRCFDDVRSSLELGVQDVEGGPQKAPEGWRGTVRDPCASHRDPRSSNRLGQCPLECLGLRRNAAYLGSLADLRTDPRLFSVALCHPLPSGAEQFDERPVGSALLPAAKVVVEILDGHPVQAQHRVLQRAGG